MTVMHTEHWLADIAEQYRSEGYDVVSQPASALVPPFARNYPIDLIASKADEKVLVQIKEDRQQLRDDQAAIALAEVIKNEPRWRFDIVVINPTAALRLAPDAAEPSLDGIEENLVAAEQMSRSGETQASYVISWAALEAAMRHAARRAGIDVKSPVPSFLLRALYAGGLLGRSEFDELNQAIKTRNAVVHGMTTPAIKPAMSQYVLGIARKLISGNGKKPAA
jgi:hypothetical protein